MKIEKNYDLDEIVAKLTERVAAVRSGRVSMGIMEATEILEVLTYIKEQEAEHE